MNECDYCKYCKENVGINAFMLPSHLKCIICNNSLTKFTFYCSECKKIIMNHVFCETCGFNMPEYVKLLLKGEY